MNFYSSSDRNPPYRRSDAYSRASAYRSRPSTVATPAAGFDPFEADFSDSFGQGRARKMIFENAESKAEEDLGDREHEHRLAMQKLTQDTQKKTYEIAKKKAEEAAKKQERRNTGSTIGGIAGGIVGNIIAPGFGGAAGSAAGGWLGGLSG